MLYADQLPFLAAAPAAPPEATGTGPASVVGHNCEVHFVDDSEWYRAFVRAFDRATKLHNLWYYCDGEVQTSLQNLCMSIGQYGFRMSFAGFFRNQNVHAYLTVY